MWYNSLVSKLIFVKYLGGWSVRRSYMSTHEGHQNFLFPAQISHHVFMSLRSCIYAEDLLISSHLEVVTPIIILSTWRKMEMCCTGW
jgi:hypothetical protein